MKKVIIALFVGVLMLGTAPVASAYGGMVMPGFVGNGPIMSVCFGHDVRFENVECTRMKKRALLIQLHNQLVALMAQLRAMQNR